MPHFDEMAIQSRRQRFNDLVDGLKRERAGIDAAGLAKDEATNYRQALDTAITGLESARTCMALAYERLAEEWIKAER